MAKEGRGGSKKLTGWIEKNLTGWIEDYMATQESLRQDVVRITSPCSRGYVGTYFWGVSIRYDTRYFLDLPSTLYAHEKKFFREKKSQSIIFSAEFWYKYQIHSNIQK